MRESSYRGPAYETARLKLARMRVEGAESRRKAFAFLARVAAETLATSRLGVFRLVESGDELELECAARDAASEANDAVRLCLAGCGELRDLLHSRRAVALDRPAQAKLGQFAEQYLGEHLERVVLAPIIRGGRAVGLVCFEFVSAEQRGPGQLDFASTVADLAALILEQAERFELEVALGATAEMRRESEKMHALAEFSRSVAHDLNNLLMVVAGAADDLREPNACPTEVAVPLEGVVEMGGRLTRALMTFSGQGPAENESLDLPGCIEEMLGVLRPLLATGQKLEVECTTSHTQARIDLVSLEQILLNLVRNAQEALDDRGGVITIRLREPEPEDPLRFRSIVLEVEDNGAGMDEVTQRRAAEPYYTTKAAPAGHGHGLASVFGIAQRYGGGVRIVSELRKGTRVAVALERAREP